MDYENSLASKTRHFFDQLYGLIILNLITLLLSLFIITILPSWVACLYSIMDLKEKGSKRILKTYFSYLWKNIEKTFLIGLLIMIILVISILSMYFYRTKLSLDNIIHQIGYWVMFIIMILVLLFSMHIPLIIVKFPKLAILDTIRLSIYICFRHFLTTLIIIGFTIIIIIGIVAFPIWFFIGISGPLYLMEKFTKPTYLYFKRIDIETIMKKIKEENQDNNERK